MCGVRLPIGRATFEFEEFLAVCEYDLGCSPETVAFYRKKITRFLKWAQREKAETLDAQAVRQFFRWLKDQGLSDNGRYTYLRALRTWFNFLVCRKVVPQSPLAGPRPRASTACLPTRVPCSLGVLWTMAGDRHQDRLHATRLRLPVSWHDILWS